jgi:hypothetical protein
MTCLLDTQIEEKVLSHRRQSVPQSEAVPFSISPYLVPLPSTPLQHPSSAFKLPPTFDGSDSSAIYHEEVVNAAPLEPVKEHAESRTFIGFVCTGPRLVSDRLYIHIAQP